MWKGINATFLLQNEHYWINLFFTIINDFWIGPFVLFYECMWTAILCMNRCIIFYIDYLYLFICSLLKKKIKIKKIFFMTGWKKNEYSGRITANRSSAVYTKVRRKHLGNMEGNIFWMKMWRKQRGSQQKKNNK